jgi:crotonobetainyl-CoA:carnitine CoA-transferase CaiB-like acyl-CoA transferase
VTGPLSHIRVLDLSRVMAGPWAGQILADLGADVVKVERPGTGDDTRAWGPPFLTGANGQPGDAGYFVAVNRGKRSVTVDLATADGQRVVRELAARSDVVLENFKAGTLARFGLEYDSLRAVRPDLVYCSITGFGQSGPKSDHAAYDFMIQAMGGLMSVTGEPDGALGGGGPQKVGVPIVDIMTGMYAAVGVLAALARRAETGEGEYIDLAMLDVQVAFLANQAANYLLSGKAPRRSGNRHPNIQPQDVFPCRDGHLALAVGNDGQFRKLAQVLGVPELADDPRYATNEARVRNVVALREAIVAELSEGDAEFWQSQLEKVGVPSSPINTVPAVFDDPQVRHRELLREVPHPVAGTIRQVASPLRLRNAPLSFDRPPPLLGQHTDEVLSELGLEQPQH